METIEPSAQTPPVFEVVAPLSEPMNTGFGDFMRGPVDHNNAPDDCKSSGPAPRESAETVCQ
jgi:hypothetical protein